ncbi:hypothetical protein MTR_6g087755 [Medicago truncatula]|uniref:Uncharacterized protein n=1 Tax=Medicago truncatula TaxID=3880 RepID=A0A072UMP4_MEDTR|nr:hypothetical protein MTR_6g087755 [Medicago truncatula]
MKFKKDYESEKWEKMGLVPSTNDVVLQSDKEAKAVPKNIERGVVMTWYILYDFFDIICAQEITCHC